MKGEIKINDPRPFSGFTVRPGQGKELPFFIKWDCPYCGFAHRQNLDDGTAYFNLVKGDIGAALKRGLNELNCCNCKKLLIGILEVKTAKTKENKTTVEYLLTCQKLDKYS